MRQGCASTPWCMALAGLASHSAGAYDAADSAYDAALAAMPVDQRCKWTDISMLVDGEPGKRYRRLACAERRDFERKFWWLSQPLYAVSGNDLRTAFFARRTMSRLEQQARSAYNLSWGSDVEELLMRFGWPTWWTRDNPSSIASPGPPAIVGHEPSPSFFFHPSSRLLERSPVDTIPKTGSGANCHPPVTRPLARASRISNPGRALPPRDSAQSSRTTHARLAFEAAYRRAALAVVAPRRR